jgi:hypothetical protein
MNLKGIWMSLPRAARIYLSVVGALGVAGVATVVTVGATVTPLLAASPSPSPSPSSGTDYCSRFTGHLASDLGKSQSQVQKAISDAINQTIDDAVKNGDLTRSQADAIKSRLTAKGSAQECAAIPRIAGRGGPGIGAPGFLPARKGPGLDEYAKALGISQSELQQDLKSGKTVKDVAASKGMDEAAFRTALVNATRSDLDAQVKAGKITQKQEDAILQRIQNGPLPLWDRTIKPHPAPSPTATP